jgi:hypothetical protein
VGSPVGVHEYLGTGRGVGSYLVRLSGDNGDSDDSNDKNTGVNTDNEGGWAVRILGRHTGEILDGVG